MTISAFINDSGLGFAKDRSGHTTGWTKFAQDFSHASGLQALFIVRDRMGQFQANLLARKSSHRCFGCFISVHTTHFLLLGLFAGYFLLNRSMPATRMVTAKMLSLKNEKSSGKNR
jgi:hypothetical protein